MAQGGIERRVAAINRWLERFQRSYRSGAMESALMDAECARADLEDLRLDVWERVGRASIPRRLRVGAVCGLLLSTSLIVMATASPVAKGEGSVPAAVQVSPSRLCAAAESASPAPPAVQPVAKASAAAPVQKAVRREPRPLPVKKEKERPVRRAAAEPVQKAVPAKHPARVLPDNEVFSLVQTGSRALRNEDPVIKIRRRIGKGEDNP
ncbi:MAG: hypothetical protein K6E38_00485 [Fretibacterium sp.]|nr:hypothetical protein [Fretibacterium sp.]